MGIYIFTWKALKEALDQDVGRAQAVTFGKHVIPYCHRARVSGFLLMNTTATGRMWERSSSYWEANMELIDIIPEFNLYEEYWKIYTKSDITPASVHGRRCHDRAEHHRRGHRGLRRGRSILLSVPALRSARAQWCRDSIIMKGSVDRQRELWSNKAIVAENVTIGENAQARRRRVCTKQI